MARVAVAVAEGEVARFLGANSSATPGRVRARPKYLGGLGEGVRNVWIWLMVFLGELVDERNRKGATGGR